MNRTRILSLLILIFAAISLAPLATAQDTNARTLTVSPNGDYATLTAALNAAHTGDVIEVHGGVHPAPLVIHKSVTLRGMARGGVAHRDVGQPVIDGGGTGTVVNITAPDVHFEGFTVRGSGDNLNHEDTGIVVQAANVTIVNNTLEDVLFGIYFANASAGFAQNNRVRCYPREIGVRGDGMRVWFSSDVTLKANDIRGCRDTLIWYAENVLITDNHFADSRYGLHFMYSSGAEITRNTFSGNSVGTYLMYSKHLTMTDNLMQGNRGPSGYGIALKEIDYATIQGNRLISNRSGLYIDNAPALVDVTNIYTSNLFAYNDIGISALPSTARNIFTSNIFLENNQQISVLGRGNLLNNTWNAESGNYWSDYAGYDGDGDGVGDMPYRAEKLFESLTDTYPAVKLFTYSPASQALDFAAAAFPALRPDPKVIDSAPMMHYTLPPNLTVSQQAAPFPFLLAALMLVGTGAGIVLYAMRHAMRGRLSQNTSPANTGTQKEVFS